MKKFALSILAIVLAAGMLAGCGAEPAASAIPSGSSGAVLQPATPATPASGGEPYRIGIVQPMEHTSLGQIREAIIAGLESAPDAENIEIIYKNGQGDAANTNAIVTEFVGSGVDMIIPIATGAAQVAAAATTDIPIVFAAVSYPVEAGLVPALDSTTGNVTGVSNAIPVEDIIGLCQTLTPDVKTMGMLYNTGEVNAVSSVERAKAACGTAGIEVVEATITSTADLLQAVQSLTGKVDAIFTPNDNTVASAMPTLAAEAIAAKLPVYVGADSMVQDGGFATVGIDYELLGSQVAQMALRIKNGGAIADNPVEVVSVYSNMVNLATAEAIGVELPQEVLDTFTLFESEAA